MYRCNGDNLLFSCSKYIVRFRSSALPQQTCTAAFDLISLSARGIFNIQGMISECCLRCWVGTPIY